jgi:hypothetical protein
MEADMGIVEDFYRALADSQEPHGAEFDAIIYPQLWDLYEDYELVFYWGA